jgi:hypothetical protein
MAQARSGGGIKSSVNRSVGIKSGPANTRIIDPRSVFQLGTSQGDKLRPSGGHTGQPTTFPLIKGTGSQVPSGNAVAASTVAGPGGSRTIYKPGYQGTHGPVAGQREPFGRPWWKDFPGGGR